MAQETIKQRVLVYLKTWRQQPPVSPTTIGLSLGYSYNRASAAVSIPLQQLVKEGLVEKRERRYKLVPDSDNEKRLDTIIAILTSVKKDFKSAQKFDIICSLGATEALLKKLVDKIELE